MADTIATGRLPAELANAVSSDIVAACKLGMDLDEALCIAIAVISDYARGEYGDAYLDELAEIVRKRKGVPLPPGEPLSPQEKTDG